MDDPIFFGALIGGAVAVTMLLIMALGKSSRDTAVVAGPADHVVNTVRHWAAVHGYTESSDGRSLSFTRGMGVLTQPTVVNLTQLPQGHQLQAWQTLGLGLKREMALTSGNFIGIVPRKVKLKEFNALLGALGHPPISR